MKVWELKSVLEELDDADDVYVCVKEPEGYWCPDGAVVGIKKCCQGMDWHSGALLLVPENRLNVVNVGNWAKGVCDYD